MKNLKDGIYKDLPETDYHAIPRLNASGIKRLLISPMDFWARSWMNPDYKPMKSQAFDIGKAYHKRICEGPLAFRATYAPAFNPYNYPDALSTIDDLKTVLKGLGLGVSGKKQDLIDRLVNSGFKGQIIDNIRADYLQRNNGCTEIPEQLWSEITRAAEFIESHPENPFLNGDSELSILWTDAETGIPMKARIDYMRPEMIVDLKTFSSNGLTPLDVAIGRNIATYKYMVASAVYLDGYKAAFSEDTDFLFVFQRTGQESFICGRQVDKTGLAFQIAQRQMRLALKLFLQCHERYGDSPWIEDFKIETLQDETLPMWAFDE